MKSDDPQANEQQGRKGEDASKVGGTFDQLKKGPRILSEKEKAKRRRDSEHAKEWRKSNPEAARERDKKYREATSGGYAEKQRKWRAENHEHSKAYHRAYMKRRMREDINYKMRHSLSSRINTAMSRTRNVKSTTTAKLIGCSIDFFREYIAARLTPGMTLQNYGEWHVDHRIPCAKFDLSNPEQQRQCFHYTNMQPLWAKDNLSKKDQMPAGHQAEFL